jgi:hypothetical protein
MDQNKTATYFTYIYRYMHRPTCLVADLRIQNVSLQKFETFFLGGGGGGAEYGQNRK